MLLELLLLLGYQIISGYVYWQMGTLFASFMLGLFLGSFFGNKLKGYTAKKYFLFLVTLSSMIIALSVFAAYILPHLLNLSAPGNIIVFTALLIIAGAVIGGAFVIAGFLTGGDEITAKAGGLYAADLWGGAIGAVLSTNLIVPLFGILGALGFSAAVGITGLSVFLILSAKAPL